MRGNIQETIGRRRPSRVTITYDIDKGDSIESIELPVCSKVISDLGNGSYKDKFHERKHIVVDRDNFNEVMSKLAPKARINIKNVLNDRAGESIVLDFEFKNMDDFSPENVLKQNKVTNILLEARRKLKELLSKIDGNFDLEEKLTEVLSQESKIEEMHKMLQDKSSVDN